MKNRTRESKTKVRSEKIRTGVRAGASINESGVMCNPLYVGSDTAAVNPLFSN